MKKLISKIVTICLTFILTMVLSISELEVHAETLTNTYTVTFNSVGGSEIASKTVSYEAIIDAPAIPTKPGYKFDGWYKEVVSINKWDFALDKVKNNITLYAKWTSLGDLNKDGVIDILDLGSISKSYNTKSTDGAWNPNFDFNKDSIIDVYDMVLVSKEIGTIFTKSITLNNSEVRLSLGETYTLKATVLPLDATNKNVAWKSSNNAIVEVDGNGNIKPLKVGTATITVITADGDKTAACNVTIFKKGYVNNPELAIDLKVRSAPNLSGSTILGYLFNFEKVEILDSVYDSVNNILWDKIIYNGKTAYISDAYVQSYTSPPDSVVLVASKITTQFETGNNNLIVGNYDGQGLSFGYLQWCIGQGTLQPLLHRMDRQYNAEMRSIFGVNYDSIHNMLLSTKEQQLQWANSINDSSKENIIEPWKSMFLQLSNNAHFQAIEKNAEVYFVKQAMIICDKYNLKTVRDFALAFDIVVQNGSISSQADDAIKSALNENPNISEKNLLEVIAKAVSETNADVLSRKMAIVNGQGTVHQIPLNLDRDFGLSDDKWR